MLENISHLFYITFIYDDRWIFFAEGLKITLILTFASFIAGTVLGLVLCWFKMSGIPWLEKCINILNGFLMKLPTLVMLMIMLYVVFAEVSISAEIVIIIGLTLKGASYLCEIFYSAIMALNSEEGEAARTLGMTKWQAFRYVTFPQALKGAMPLYKTRFVATLQETSVVGYLAVMDLTRASEVVTARTLDAFFGLILISAMYIIIGVICTTVIDLIYREKHLGEELDD